MIIVNLIQTLLLFDFETIVLKTFVYLVVEWIPHLNYVNIVSNHRKEKEGLLISI